MFITALLATACTLGISAQSIEVTNTEGLTYKFAAERVKDITFIKTTAPEICDFSAVDATAYSSGSVEATFTTADNSKALTLWIDGKQDVNFLDAGVYNVSAEAGNMVIDPDPRSTFLKEGDKTTTLKAGTMTVAISGREYTITFDLTLADDTEFKAKYVGEMPGVVSKDFTLATCNEPKVMTTDVNGYVKGEFYVKMNDADWNYEMVVDFFADAAAAKLPAGTYTYSAENKPGTFGAKSCLNTYSPNNNFKFAEGSTVTVAYEGENISIKINGITTCGRKFDMTYNGKITFPEAAPAEETVFSSISAYVYSSYMEATFSTADNAKSMTLDISGQYLEEGVYNVTAESGDKTISSDARYSFVKEGQENKGVASGTMTVAISGREYTITCDFTLADGSEMKAKYTGSLPGMMSKDFTLATCSEPKVMTTDVNGYVKGEFYVKMNDADWNYEMVADFFADADAAKLPAGTYTYSAENKPGTFGAKSCLNIYTPSNNFKFAEGSTITVAYEGENISIKINGITTCGRKFDMTYNGKITFPENAPAE